MKVGVLPQVTGASIEQTALCGILAENQNACISRKMCAREGVFVTRKGECDLEHQAPRSGSAYISWDRCWRPRFASPASRGRLRSSRKRHRGHNRRRQSRKSARVLAARALAVKGVCGLSDGVLAEVAVAQSIQILQGLLRIGAGREEAGIVQVQAVQVHGAFHSAGVITLGVQVDQHVAAVAQLAGDDLLGDAVDHLALMRQLQRTAPLHRIVAVDGQVLHSRRRHVQGDVASLQAVAHLLELQIHDRLDSRDGQPR